MSSKTVDVVLAPGDPRGGNQLRSASIKVRGVLTRER
jgi:hypothetical protein